MKLSMNKITRTHVLIVIGLLALLPLWLERYQKQPMEIYGEVSSFGFVDALGQDFESEQLKGKVWVGNLIFTTCQGPCPLMSQNMASLHRSFVLEDQVRMVSFSVNPEQDTPELMKAYSEKYEADLNSWYFLTGSRPEITRLAIQDFRMGHLDEIAFHSTYFVLVDDLMRIRGYYDGTDEDALAKLFVDTSFLLKLAKKRKSKES